MRFYKLTLAASVLALGACGGNKDAATTDTAAAAPAAAATTTDSSAMAAPAAGGAAAGAAGATAAMAPITGKTVEVKMIGDAKGYRFEPANITVKAGDGIKFINVSGGPHNVAFDEASVPAAGKAQLTANMPNQMAPLSSPYISAPNEAYTISFANVAPGTYDYHCTPHLPMGMKGVITVQ
jgi:plastocyanin